MREVEKRKSNKEYGKGIKWKDRQTELKEKEKKKYLYLEKNESERSGKRGE